MSVPIGAIPMAFHAVAIVADSLFKMLAGDVRGRMFVATVTGVTLVVCRIGVTGSTACPMIAVEPEVAVVVEAGRFPRRRGVTGLAVTANVRVEPVAGPVGFVAFDAALARS